MFVMVDYVRRMTVKKSCIANIDRLSICSSCLRLVLLCSFVSLCLLSFALILVT